MNTLEQTIVSEIHTLPIMSQKEVLDFVLFIKQKSSFETDYEYLSKNAEIKQAIIDGLNTPLDECSTNSINPAQSTRNGKISSYQEKSLVNENG